ncbi:hypothetical protein CHS0354_002932 [Potamilus streckersoni]|uniref:Poly [ADP-ribose] polymerase n=1 Tax=Potamilus streckersoni TaxID=2493646 RepID=A0AAE0RQH8_9BIVA|nr:hypothetical protein CHS0354_002932 [Potamilus streckersoni]
MASDDLKHLSPKEIWEEEIKPANILVVKNISSAITEETLQNYLEIVTGEELTSLYLYPDVTSICIAVFKNEVADLEAVQKKAEKKILEKTILELLPFGDISGLLLSNISGPVGNDGLTLYFESRKCGSQGANVKDCKQLMDLNIVVINMNASPEVFTKIVNKTDHQTAGVTFAVEPYYSTFHDPVFKALQDRNIRDVRSNMANIPTEITTTKPAGAPSARLLHTGPSATLGPDLKLTSLQNNSTGGEGSSRRKEIQHRISSPQPGSGSENYIKFSNTPDDEMISDSSAFFKPSEKLQFAASSYDNNGYNMRTQTLPNSNIFPIQHIRPPQAYNNSQQKSLSGGLQIFTNSNSPLLAFADGSKSIGPHPEDSSVTDVHPSQKTKKKYRKVKKSSDPKRSRSSAKYVQSPAVSSVGQGQSDLEGQSQMGTEQESETVSMILEHIMLLIIDSFQKKCTFCTIKFDTRLEVIRLSGQKSNVQKAKLMMDTTLKKKHEVTSSSTVTELHQKLLVLQKTNDAMRVLLKSKGIYAFVLMKEDKHLHSYALNYHHAKNGLDLIEESLVQSTVHLTEGQDKLLTGSEWTSLVQSIEQGNIIKIQQDTKMVEIGGLHQVAVEQTHNEISTFLKNTKPLNTYKQVIDGALARCFKTELADGARDKVKNSGGSLKMQELPNQSGSVKFQIEMEVLGSDSAVETFKTALKSIWHERLDLYTLCSSEDELQLVVQALSRKGKDFIKSFEGRHHCYIDLTLPAGKFEIAMKSSALKEHRIKKKADFPAVYDANPLDYSQREPHMKHEMESRDRVQKGLQNPLYKRIGSVPNLFVTSPMQSPQAKVEALIKQETDGIPSLGYHRRPQFRRQEIADELLPFPRAVDEYKAEKSMTLEGLEDKAADMRKELKVGSVSIVVKQGEITKEQAYALLNIVPPSRDLSKESVISQSFVKAGGQELVQMYNNNVKFEEDGFVLTAGTGNLKCDVILHVMLKTRVDDTEREVRKAMTTCFEKCKTFGVTTLALPPLGCGRLHRYNEDSVVEAMLEETLKLALGTPGIMRKVTIVVYDQDLCQKFFKKLSSLEIYSTPSHPFLDLTKVNKEKKDVNKQNVSDDRRDRYIFGDESDYKNIHLLHSESSPAIFHDQSKEPKQSSHSSEHQERGRTANDAFKLGATKESAVTVKVFAKDKQSCLDCVKNLAKEMKENYLFESEPVSKKHELPPEHKKKIKDILSKHEATVKQKRVTKGVFILKGWKEEVYATHNAILKVLFESSETTRNRKSHYKRPSSDFWMSKTFEQPETPEYWSMGNKVIKDLISKFAVTLSGKKSKLVDVDTATFQEIVKLVDDTWQGQFVGQGNDAVNLRHSRIKVLKVTMVENLDLFDLYFKKRQEIFKSLWKSKQESFPQLEKVKGCRDQGYIKTSRVGKCLKRDIYPEINEYYFFHGTKVDKIDAICENGLDCRLGSEKAMLGTGVYGAESSTKADQYTDAKQARTPGEKKMFLMRMVLGNMFVCTDPNPHKYRRPPCKTCIKDDCANARHTEGYFDSVVGDMGKLFREFVVYDKNQCYPEYIITYARV